MGLALAAFALASAQFQVIKQVDPLDDTEAAYALLGDARRHIAVGCGDITDPASIRVVVKFGRYIGDGKPGILAGGTYLHYRFDAREPNTVRWYSHDDTVTAEAERTKALKFFSEMKGTTKLFLRAVNYGGDQTDLAFTYEDPTPQIEDVLARCGFNPDGSIRASQKNEP